MDEEKMNGEEVEWLGRQEVDGTYTEGIAFILLEARGPIGRDSWDKELGTGRPTAASTTSKPHFQPQTPPPVGTFLAPSFSAFFLASSKSSTCPMLA